LSSLIACEDDTDARIGNPISSAMNTANKTVPVVRLTRNGKAV